MATAGPKLDLSQPLATLLREATKEPHQRVETGPGAKLLLSGQLPKEQYIQFLMMLWHVYDAFETALERHSTHPTLEPTNNPVLLGRAAALASDISFLLQVPLSKWESHPLHASLLTSMPVGLRDYVDRINIIADSSDPSALLAHSYVRYLGDLSGGQIIKRVAVKAYGLDEANGAGIEFYQFNALGSSTKANQGDMKKIKEWFREGMNKGGERNDEVKAAVVNEANLAFELNAGLFDTLEVLALAASFEKGEDTTVTPSKVSKYNTEKTYTLVSVAGFVVAACLAHFMLVGGSFVDNKDLLAFERCWLATLFSGSPAH